MGSSPITPIRIPRGVRTLLIYGGTFDPPHRFHVEGPRAAARMFGPAREVAIVYVPASRNPLKDRGPQVSDTDRVAMLRLALRDAGPRGPRTLVWTDEINRATGLAPSYMVDTLRRLRSLVPARVTLRLLIGSDQVSRFHEWKSPRRVIALAEPLVMLRAPIDRVDRVFDVLDGAFWTTAERAAWCGRLAPTEPLEAASTEIRGLMARGRSEPRLRELLPPRVLRFIRERGLYRS